MLAVVIPAHNEEAFIARCIESVLRASLHPVLNAESVEIFVIADSCCDRTISIAHAMNVHVLRVAERNVGAARAKGADAAISLGARWLSFTDADTTVPPDWLVQQLRCNVDVVCGVIAVDDWSAHDPGVQADFIATYHDADGHRHIHGANLGVAVNAYQRVGGFRSYTFNEDVALVEALLDVDATVAWSANVRVTTSARLDFRAPGGFGAALRSVTRRLTFSPSLPSEVDVRYENAISLGATNAPKA